MKTVNSLPLPVAQQTLINAAHPVATEVIPSQSAAGRVLAEDITTSHAFPDTRRSAVDGYAVCDVSQKQHTIVETLGAGEQSSTILLDGQAAAVMTGATVPDGSQAVVRVEETSVQDQSLTLNQLAQRGENINRVGEEMYCGETVLTCGMRLTPVRHSVLCCTGRADVKVYRLPQVGILITGDEVLQLGETHRPGRVYDSNRHFLVGTLAQLGINAMVLGPVKDDEETIKSSLSTLAETCDLVISSGGVSMGKYDFIRPLLHSNGFDVLVNRTGIKPGRPLIVAQNEGTLFFGMPGYPAACLVNFFYYLLPTVKRLMGMTGVLPVTRNVLLADDLSGRKNRWDIIRANLQISDDQERAYKLDSQLTSHFLNFGISDGLILLDGQTDQVPAGTTVPFLDFSLQF